MNRLIHHDFLLAQGGRLSDLAHGFNRRRNRYDAGDVVVFLLIMAALVAAIGILSYLSRLRQQRGYVSPLRLFLSLCRAHDYVGRRRGCCGAWPDFTAW